MIPTHSLPPLDYEIPASLSPKVGSLVVAPLSDRFRLGVVVEVGDADDKLATESLVSVSGDICLPEVVVRLCEWAAGRAAISPAAALRAALPPGIETDKYLIVRPRRGWRWGAGEIVGRAELKRVLGGTAMDAAELVGRIELSPNLPRPSAEEWAFVRNGADPDFGRAFRQSEMFAALRESGGGMPVSELLSKSGASRSVLRSLAGRGAVGVEARPSNPIVVSSGEGSSATPRGSGSGLGGEFERGVSSAASRTPERGVSSPDPRGVGREFDRGVSTAMGRGSSLWRMPSGDVPEAVAAMGRAVVGGGKTMLVLAPEIRHVDGLVRHLERSLPRGATVAAYHGGIGRDRAEVWRLSGRGEIDVLVGTRAAALAPMARLGAICVADEPNEAHRAEPGYEGLPMHVRELAARRGNMEDVPALFLSPTPSLRLFSSEGGSEIPPRRAGGWPSVRLVDMRGSGAYVSSTLVSACRGAVASGGSVGVVVDRLGYATAVSCLNCGGVRSCPECGIPLSLRGKTLTCARCGHRERYEPECPECGSDRVSPTGMAVERVRERLSDLLEMDVGLLTANERDLDGDPRVVVGTARPILAREWDAVAIPDADSFLMGGWMGSVERAFRVFHSAAESARTLLVAQTRNPDHYALQSALREDYETFASVELPRLRRLGYPPYSHLATLTFHGRGDAVRGAVKSMLPAFGGDVEASEAVHVPGSKPSRWRVVLRSQSRGAVAKAATEAARRLSKSKVRGLEMEVEIDPEEV